MKKIAIYGKGGIGKSTTASNLTAALACQGYRGYADRVRPEGGFDKKFGRRKTDHHRAGSDEGKRRCTDTW